MKASFVLATSSDPRTTTTVPENQNWMNIEHASQEIVPQSPPRPSARESIFANIPTSLNTSSSPITQQSAYLQQVPTTPLLKRSVTGPRSYSQTPSKFQKIEF
jgi:hypothetical protein